jgi:2-oxoglutarate dehydrogenase E2 component (dihydrolipoamide succinyltransferase)
VRKRLQETGLDPAAIHGTGSGGRVTLEDVEKALGKLTARPAPVAPAPQPGVTRIPHDNMRRRIAEHMAHSLATAPHVTAVFEADLSAIVAHRAAHKAAFEAKGAALTYTTYFVSAAATAMPTAPAVNARWTENALELYDDINIGVGVALADKGLVVPVVRRAQDLSLLDIATRLTDLTQRARDGKLAPADVQGGTFSISNHGVSGTLIAAPIIINQPQSAILGLGKMEKRAVVRDDQIVIRPMCYVTLTIDHRVLDGAQCNAWLTKFVETIENWPA